MLIAGALLLVVAAVALFIARSSREAARAAAATETLGCGDLAALSDGVAGEIGGGGFRQRWEVVGTTAPGPAGAVRAPESELDVVWARTKVTHKYWVMEEGEIDGRRTRQRREREEVVSEIDSQAPFAVDDGSGAVLVHPDGADVDRPEHVVDRFEPAATGAQRSEGMLASFLRAGAESGTLGFRHEEWVLRPGARVYVQGEVADHTGAVAFARPQDGGRFVISTRSEEEIVAGAQQRARIAVAVAAVAAVAGAGLVVAGLLA